MKRIAWAKQSGLTIAPLISRNPMQSIGNAKPGANRHGAAKGGPSAEELGCKNQSRSLGAEGNSRSRSPATKLTTPDFREDAVTRRDPTPATGGTAAATAATFPTPLPTAVACLGRSNAQIGRRELVQTQEEGFSLRVVDDGNQLILEPGKNVSMAARSPSPRPSLPPDIP